MGGIPKDPGGCGPEKTEGISSGWLLRETRVVLCGPEGDKVSIGKNFLLVMFREGMSCIPTPWEYWSRGWSHFTQLLSKRFQHLLHGSVVHTYSFSQCPTV